MRKSLFPIIILLTIISCGKKRAITSEGTVLVNGAKIHWQTYTENDTFYKTWSDNGRMLSMAAAVSEAAFSDSTFSEKRFSPEGKIILAGNLIKGKREGEWLSFYNSGHKQSRKTYKNGIQLNYEAWYESGQLQVKEELLSDSVFRSKEYFENGHSKKEMATDKNGNGYKTSYYLNGKIKETGPLLDFKPSGIWKSFDTIGNLKTDTLLGLKPQ